MYRWLISFFAAVCLSLVPISVQAEGSSSGKSVYDTINNSDQKGEKEKAPAETSPVNAKSESTFMMLVKLVFMLGIVLAILFFVLRFIQRKSVSFQDGKNLQSLGGIGIGQNRSVQLIKTGNSVLVVGVGDSVTLLKEITNEDEVQMMLDQRPSQNVSTMTNQLKQKWLKSRTEESSKTSNETRPADTKDQTQSFKTMLQSIVQDKKNQQKDLQRVLEKGKHHE
ncbi:flagellar biosynthetic protein FliO [Fictibacillus sp. 23RED33]|uniref:flagellar biosynthetic protein FliO n=1 Tax=Fictibacillus sp. 23RED33 TaxID=2745879 RepID=UPI0018CCA81C|nr:flagellar biosynthetic protein FliO [Fictibacillus sp. 23RED33]MBH0173087.1 flagellar biosynthetic protein FliO [Fictibacillus sp. 23RED33]